MKKTVFFLGCLALLMAGCNKGQTVAEPAEEVPQLKFNITVNFVDDTRAVKRNWDVGDKIYLAFDVSFLEELGGYATNHGYVTMTFNGSSFDTPQSSDASFTRALMQSPSGYLAAVYLSDDRTPQFQFVGQGEMFQKLEITNGDRLGGYCMKAEKVPYTIDGSTLTAEINLKLNQDKNNLPVHFFLDGISSEKAGHYSLRCTKLRYHRFVGFYLLVLNLSGSSSPLGPWVMEEVPDFDEPFYGSYYDGGLEFVGYLDKDIAGAPMDYYMVVVDNNGTPDNTADDVWYGMSKSNVVLDGKEAIKLPVLTNSDKWTIFSPSGIDVDFNGFTDPVQW